MSSFVTLLIFAGVCALWWWDEKRRRKPQKTSEQGEREKQFSMLQALHGALHKRDKELDTYRERERLYEAERERARNEILQSQETIRILRAASGIHPGYDEQRELLRRAYHAIRILHEYRFCKLIGCEYCALGKEIVTAVGTQKLMQETTIRKLAKDRSEQGAGIAGYLAHIKDRVI